jgi:hypothetical protein
MLPASYLNAQSISLCMIMVFVNCFILVLKWIFIVHHLILPVLVLIDISWLAFYSYSIITLTISKSFNLKLNYDLGTALGSSLQPWSLVWASIAHFFHPRQRDVCNVRLPSQSTDKQWKLTEFFDAKIISVTFCDSSKRTQDRRFYKEIESQFICEKRATNFNSLNFVLLRKYFHVPGDSGCVLFSSAFKVTFLVLPYVMR